MSVFAFSNAAIFSLHKLSRQIYIEAGLRCRLSGKVNILRLLKFASISSIKSIRYFYIAFLKELSLQQLQALMVYGIDLPGKFVKQLDKHIVPWFSRRVKAMTVCLFNFIDKLWPAS